MVEEAVDLLETDRPAGPYVVVQIQIIIWDPLANFSHFGHSSVGKPPCTLEKYCTQQV